VPLVWGLALAERAETSKRTLLLAGGCLGAALVLRVQLGPALLLAAAWACRGRPRERVLPLLIGGLIPVALYGVVDWITWGAPFHSVEVYITANLAGIANGFGVQPPLHYARIEHGVWGVATPLILGTALIGSWRLRGPAAVGAAIFVTFSLVGHKEPRYVYPVLPLLFTLCGVGTADLLQWAREGRNRGLATSLMLMAWITASVSAGTSPFMREAWRSQHLVLRAFEQINRDPAACGVAVHRLTAWPLTGRVRLRRDIGLFNGDPGLVARDAGAFNNILTLVARQPPEYASAGFALVACDGKELRICRYRRDGGCADTQGVPLRALAPPHVVAVLEALGYRQR
jgi:hypothetical protein